MNLNHEDLELYLLQPFLSNKIDINIEDTNNQKKFFDLAKSFQLSSYLLNSINYSKKTMPLKENLVRLANNYLKKNLLMRYEISLIAKLFHDNNIEYVVLKGMAMKIKQIDPYRQFRDLDILIAKEDLKQAYELLVDTGYSYFEKKTCNSTKYIRDMHHLPPMINNTGVIVELHHRVTLPSLFYSCPLTDVAFLEKEIFNGINVPSNNVLLAHTLYHGILHHELKNGPMFLLDMKSILKNNELNGDSTNYLLEKLNLTSEYKQSKLIIEGCHNKKNIDNLLLKKLYSLFNGNEVFPKKSHHKKKKLFLFRMVKLYRFNSYYYQLPYWSPKLILFIFKKFFKKIDT